MENTQNNNNALVVQRNEIPYNLCIDFLDEGRKQGLTVEANAFFTPISEEINRELIEQWGNTLYLASQHRNILHTVLLLHIQGKTERAKVCTQTLSYGWNTNIYSSGFLHNSVWVGHSILCSHPFILCEPKQSNTISSV